MKACFRVDYSPEIGTGHLFRCLTLANALQTRGIQSVFVCRWLPEYLRILIKKRGYPVYKLSKKDPIRVTNRSENDYRKWLGVNWQEDAEDVQRLLQNEISDLTWLIVDHYSIDEKWESSLRSYIKRIMVIDDLANRRHNCDLLLDQNYYHNQYFRYDGLIPGNTQKLLGPRYALLRPEFRFARERLRQRDSIIRRILIFFGGYDLSNETSKTLESFYQLNQKNLILDVIIGADNPHKSIIEKLTSNLPQVHLHHHVNNMAELMVNSDLFVGSAGITTWERCCLGLPSLVVTIADNQIEATKDLDEINVLYYVGKHSSVTSDIIRAKIEYFLSNTNILKDYIKNSLQLVDGLGAEYCCEVLQHLS